MEARDLTGSGDDCLITREPFRLGPETRGVNLIIRRIEGHGFMILWTAPLESRNLASYPPKLQILQPPERNIGAAGTVTTGEVSFRQRGEVFEPAWKGKVEFYSVGSEKPLDTTTFEKVSPWDGTRFAPLK